MIKISTIQEEEISEIVHYVKSVRKTLFPMLDHTKVPKDLQFFRETYLENPMAVFLQARDNGKLIGVIGMMQYDNRFADLSIPTQRTVEVARLFVEPEYRNKGIATDLVDKIKDFAKQKKVEYLYLHTHHFLTGAYDFWLKQNFQLIATTMEGGFETLHLGYSFR